MMGSESPHMLRYIRRDPGPAMNWDSGKQQWQFVETPPVDIMDLFFGLHAMDMEPTPIHDDLVTAFANARRSSRPGGRCFWIDTGGSTSRCLTCGDIDFDLEYEDDYS